MKITPGYESTRYRGDSDVSVLEKMSGFNKTSGGGGSDNEDNNEDKASEAGV